MRNKRGAVVFFCRLLLSPIASIFGSGVPYTARTFLSRIAPAADRSTLSGDKGTIFEGEKSNLGTNFILKRYEFYFKLNG